MKFYSFEIRLVDIYQRGALGKETFPVFWQRTNISWAVGIIQLIKVSINTFFVNKVLNTLVFLPSLTAPQSMTGFCAATGIVLTVPRQLFGFRNYALCRLNIR